MSISDEVVERLLMESGDGQFQARSLYELFHLYDGEDDQEELGYLDGDGYWAQELRVRGKKLSEYGAVIQLSILAQATVHAGMAARVVYHICDFFLERIAAAGGAEEYREILSDAMEFFKSNMERRSTGAPQSPLIVRCKKYVDEHLTNAFTLEDAAAALGVSPGYLSAQFSRYEQMTFKEYVLRMRVYAAERMLKNPEHSIGCIANTLRFCSQSHFSQVFKRYAGMTPSAYRDAQRVRSED